MSLYGLNDSSSNNASGVFEGESAIWEFLNPANHPPTPLVELPTCLNEFRDCGVRIFAKQLQLLPLLNSKSLPAYSMVEASVAQNLVGAGGEIIESSSMNTAISLAVLARQHGIENTTAVIDDNTDPSLLQLLRLFGVKIHLHPFVADPDNDLRPSRVQEAKRLAAERGAFNYGQHSNFNNPLSHEKKTGLELWQQTKGKISVFSATLGTTGTFVGSMTSLRKLNPMIFGLGVLRAPDEVVPGPRTLKLLADVEFPWEDLIDEACDGSAKESFETSVELIRQGLIVGPSSGLNLVGIRKFLRQRVAEGRLDCLRNGDGEVLVCFICCDTPFPHMARYFSVLGEDFFK